MVLTLDQCRVVYGNEYDMHVVARAGTGKTTVLLEYAKAHPDMRIGYFSYNEGIKKDSRRRFPGNTVVDSYHSWAYKLYRERYKGRIVKGFSLRQFKEETGLDYEPAEKIWSALRLFFVSDAETPTHPDPSIEKAAVKIWNAMRNEKGGFYIPLDGVLKVASIEGKVPEYNVLLVDEAQDLMPVSRLLLEKMNKPTVYVGDDLQSIYGYAGTISVLTSKTHELKETFRFGQEIADLVNAFLFDYAPGVEIVTNIPGGGLNAPVDDDKVVLVARTNAYIFDKAVEYAMNNKKIHIFGGNEVFEMMEDISFLRRGDLFRVQSPFIRGFGTFEAMKAFAKKTEDPETRLAVKISEKYGENIEEFIKIVKRKLVSPSFADIMLTTAHKAKGREFSAVRLGDDFVSLFGKDGRIRSAIPDEERNIYYVAMTRATENLILNAELNKKYGG